MNGLVGEVNVDVRLFDDKEVVMVERVGVRDFVIVGVRDFVIVGVLDLVIVGVLDLVIVGDVIDRLKLVTDSSVIGDVGKLGLDGVGLND